MIIAITSLVESWVKTSLRLLASLLGKCRGCWFVSHLQLFRHQNQSVSKNFNARAICFFVTFDLYIKNFVCRLPIITEDKYENNVDIQREKFRIFVIENTTSINFFFGVGTTVSERVIK